MPGVYKCNKPEDKGPKRLVGKLVLNIEAVGDDWYSKIEPVMLTTDPREYVKLALLCAAVQQYLRDSTGFINNLVKNAKDIDAEKLNMVKGKVVADVDKYQQPLPLKVNEVNNDGTRKNKEGDTT